ncbi:MAG: pilus assembly PilX family protein [Neptuniibacter sp.]
MNSKIIRPNGRNQKGAATLLVTVILLALITLVTVYITKLGLLEVKTGANANRAKEALHHAQAGLDYGALRYLDEGSSFTSGALAVGGTSVAITAVVSGSLYTISATGISEDGTGTAVVQEGYGRVPIVDFGELPPLMSNGNFPPGGTFSIVGNPNGGGTGVPVSAWVASSATVGVASWQTCNMDEFLYEGTNSSQTQSEQDDGFIRCDTCRCQQATNTLCEAGDVTNPADCIDIVQQTDIPDTFENTFGVASTAWASYKAAAADETIACDDLNSSVGEQFYIGDKQGQLPLVWITGNCSIPANTQVGSYDYPIILVVHGNLTMNSNSTFFGIMFSFSDIYTTTPAESFNITINGSPTVYGVILVNSNVNLPTGSFTLVYSQNILEKLSNAVDDDKYIIGRRSGSWTDF